MNESLPQVSGALDRESLRRLLDATPPLVEGLRDLRDQVQPNGIDLTLRSAAWFGSPGQIGVTAAERILSATAELEFDSEGWAHLAPGPYLITLNEVVHLPKGIMALAWPRSSLLRCGVFIHNAVWDAGYEGRSQCLLTVINPHGFRVARDSKVLQMVFFTLTQTVAEGYQGKYQRENL